MVAEGRRKSRLGDYTGSLVIIGTLVLVLGLFSGFLRARVPLSEPLVALGAGVMFGPYVTGLLDVARWGEVHKILERAAEVTLAIALMGVALRIPKKDIFRRIRTVAVLLLLMMPVMALASGLLVLAFAGLPLLVSLLAGACLAPTDPVVSSTVVVGKPAEDSLPDHLKSSLSEESGFNDGLAYPLVFLPILLLQHPPGAALWQWAWEIVLWKVGFACVLGAIIGVGAGKLFEFALKQEVIEKTSVLGYTLALSIASLGIARLSGTDGLLAVFVTGIAFDLSVKESEQTEEEGMQEAMERFFTIPIFVLFGVVLPLKDWLGLGLAGVGLALGVLLLRRLPWMLLLRPLLRDVRSRKDALFLGWFGPLGVAPIYYGSLVLSRTEHYAVWPVVSLVVTASVLAHGVTSLPFTRWYARA